MTYNFVADRIEVRSSMHNDKPRYVVKGTALIANQKDIYDYEKRPDGSFKTLKSIFTPNCIKSIKEQSKHKKLFVDSQHELALNSNIKSLMKGKLNTEEEGKLNKFLKGKMLPLAKLNDINVSDNAIEIDTELNPAFRDIDESHQRYFDAVWSSLENKYINGISINLANFKAIKQGDEMVIDDVDVIGFSYVDAPAHHSNSITEVAIRAMQDSTNQGVDEKMEDEKKKLEDEKAKLAEDKKKFDEEQATVQKQKDEEKAKSEEAAKKKLIDDEKAEFEKLKKDLDEKNEALKKAAEEKKELEDKMNSGKGVVKDIKNPNQPQPGNTPNDSVYLDNLKKITEEHNKTIELINSGKKPLIDKSMSGFGELINLGHQAGNPTADLSEKDAAFVREHRLLDKGGADLVAPRREK